ncbi:GlsB/YeaQ/YmgE family stress response membrane protein [Acidothermaceae bacterium B102]|nr:GlsB/YeaQ/YmgE family stress response membrane protein [Acidothermaceae bacterium B102]
MNILWAVIAGLVIGGLARLFLVRGQKIPLWLTCFLGICGGLIGDAISRKLGVRHTSGIDWTRHVLQVCSAAVLIGVIAPLWGGRKRRR